ncbi:MAG TPA: hypothetical protein VGV09_02450 [Steroidobacteraceae bacterium]|nr:hypothetical protein [Steroidobacteraceae bacterium]
MKLLRNLLLTFRRIKPQFLGGGQMAVYSWSMYGSGTLLVSPGRDRPEVDGWVDIITPSMVSGQPIKRVPRLISVRLMDGKAIVDAQLGYWLIEHGHAHFTPEDAAKSMPPPDTTASNVAVLYDGHHALSITSIARNSSYVKR